MTVKNIGVNSLLLSSCERGEHQSSRRATLLSGTALAAGVIAGMLFMPSGALAACVNSGGSVVTNTTGSGLTQITTTTTTPNHTATCDTDTSTDTSTRNMLPTVNVGSNAEITGEGVKAEGAVLNGSIKIQSWPVSVTTPTFHDHPDATVNNNGSVTSTTTGVNGVDVQGYKPGGVVALGNATYSGTGNVTGAANGVKLDGVDAKATVVGGTIIGNSGDGIKANALNEAAVNFTGANVSGRDDGMNLTGGVGGATAKVTEGSVTGITGNGITANSGLGIAKADLIGATIKGTKDGVNLNGGKGAVVEMTGGSVTGGANGLNLNSTVVDVNLTGGTVTGNDGDGIKSMAAGLPLIGGGTTNIKTLGTAILGSQNGINATTAGGGVDASTDILVNGGSVTGTNGSGISALTIAATIGSTRDASTSVKGSANITGGTIGVLAGAGSLNGDANTVVDVSGSVTGGNVGVAAVAGSIGGDPAVLTDLLSDPTNIANLASLAAGNGKATVDVKTSGTVTADDGVGILAVGLGTGNKVSVDASGQVTSANGIGVLAGSIGAGGTVNVAVKDVTGGIAGVIGINTDGDTNVTATGNVEFGGLVGLGAIALSGGNATATLAGGGEVSSNGGLIGVAAISDGGNATINIHGDIDPPLIGGGAIALGSGTANALTSGAIDADLLGVVSLNIGNGRAVVDSSSALESSAGTGLVGLAGVKVGDQNSSGQPDVYIKNTGTIDDYQVGIAGVAVGKGNHIDINNRGDITAGLAGISGVAVGDDSKVTVSNRGDIVAGGTGIAAVTSGANGTITIANRGDIDAEIAGIIGVGAGDDSAVSITSRGDILTEGAGITAVTTGVNGVVSIRNRGDIESGLAGVSGVAVGNDSTVFISNRGDINSGGAGLTAVVTGENGTVNIRNRGDIDATLAGITGVAVGDNSKITVTNSGIITSEAAGITAVTTGEKGDVNITNTDAIIAGLTGISGVAVGDGSKVSISTSGSVDAGVLGVAGFVDGKGGTVDVNTNALIRSTGTGVLGGASGEGSEVNVTTHQAVSGDILGVGGVLVGDAHELNIITKDTVTSDHGIAVGTVAVGDSNKINIRTKVAVTGDLGGVDIVAVGDDNTIEINTENTVSSAHGIAIGTVIAGDDNTIKVRPDDAVTGDLGGVGIVAAGNGNNLDIETQGQVTSANGFGVMGVAIGDADNIVNIVTKEEVNGKYLGVGGTVGGDNSKLTILTENDVNSSSGFGVAGLGIGDNQAVDIHTLTAVNGDGLGVGGQIVGQGTVTITTDGKVTSASGIGVSGGAVGDGPSDVKITTKDTVDGKLVGVAGNIGGDGSSLTITTQEAVTSSSGAGIAAASAGDGNSVDIHAEDSVSGDEAGVLALTFGDATDVEITTDGTVDASDGVGILATTIGNGGTLNITTGGAVTATASGIIGMNSGGSTDIQIGNTVTVESGGEFGAFALGGGLGNANIGVNGVISGAKTGAAALTIGSGDATVTSNQLVTASELGLGGSNIGTGNVILTNNAAIQSDGSGIAAVKAGASGSVEINVNADISGLSGSATGGDGVLVISSTTDLGTVDVALKDGVSIKSEESGINAIKLTGDGDVTIAVGEESAITAELAGVHAASMLGNGDVIITTGKDSAIRAGVGIAATKGLGTGDVDISLGEDSMIEGYIGVAANNLADEGNVQVVLSEGAHVIANRIGVEAGSIDGDVKLTADADTLIFAANGQAIWAAAAGEVDISTAGLVLGDGSDTKAVVTIRSGDSANYHNQAGGIITSTDLDEAKLAFDAKGGPLTFTNDGVLVGRVDLTSNDDVLHNNSSNSWYVSGVSDFGAGNDLLTNTGKIRTSFDGGGGEYAEFRSLENFINGDLNGLGTGTLTMQGETHGLLGFDAARDVTMTGGNYTGIGNATLAVDAYLGQAGSTSDVLLVEGTTDGSTLVNVRDMNSGPGAYNPTGIKVVDVLGGAGSASNFSIDPMSANAMRGGHHVIDKGLFFYDMALVGAATIANPDRNQFRLIGVPDHEVFELPSLVSGAQSIWHETAGVWLDRQADLRNQLGSEVALPEGYVSKDGPISMPPSNGNVTPGVWAKAVGSWTDRDNGSSFSIHNNSYSYDTSYKQNTYGVIAGIDFGNEDVFTNGDAVIFGVMAGYLSSDLDFKASNTSADYSGGTVGLYGTYLNNGFFADALIKADFLKMDYSASSMGVSEKSDVNTYGFTLDTGYRFDLKNKLFLEPVATLSYAKTSMDDLTSIPGAYVAFPKNDSLRGSLGMRFGGEVAKNENYRMEASMTGRVWNEFNANNRADIHSGGSILKVSDDFKGAFGEIGGIINIHATSDKWSGFVSGSYKFNGDFKSGSVRGGVRLQW